MTYAAYRERRSAFVPNSGPGGKERPDQGDGFVDQSVGVLLPIARGPLSTIAGA